MSQAPTKLSSDALAVVQDVLAKSPRQHISPAELAEIAELWDACTRVTIDGHDHPERRRFRESWLRLMRPEDGA